VQLLHTLRHELNDDDDGNAEQHSPDAPQQTPKQQRYINTAAEFKWAIPPVIQAVTNVSTSLAIASDAPATRSAIAKDWHCMKAAMRVATVVMPGPPMTTQRT
jgi:hypothetical protein